MRVNSYKFTLRGISISLLVVPLAALCFLFIRPAPAATFFSTQEPVTHVQKITHEVMADDPGAVVVEQTENSIKFKLSNGQYRLISVIGKLYTQDGLEIDPTLKNISSKWWEVWKWGQDDWLAQTGEGLDYAIKIGEAGNRQFTPRKTHPDEYIELGSPEYYDGRTWLPLPLNKPKIEENRIFWENDSYTLEYIITPTGSKSNLILNDLSANHPLRWPVVLNNLIQDNGDILSHSDNTMVATLQEPFWTDANQEAGEVSWEIQPQYIQFTPQILEGAVYPVTVDPNVGISVGVGADDGYVASTTFNSSAIFVYCGRDNSTGYTFNPFIRWDGVGLDGNETIDSAYLKTTIVSLVDSGTNPTVTIYFVKEADPAAPTSYATWTADPHTTATASFTVHGLMGTVGQLWTSPNLKTLLQEIIDQATWAENNAVMWHSHAGSSGNVLVQFASYENTTYDPPLFDITYTLPPGITITESDGTTVITEGGATDSYTMVLDSQPTADVTVPVTDDSQVDTDKYPSLVFTTGNWSTPQTVTVTATNDSIDEDDNTGTIVHTPVTSSDSNYAGISVNSVVATVHDNDTAGVTVTGT
ncbi:MAG: hypothetical protein PHV43_02140 [Candidatus Colwellbacteria bacterium]|nr:hypothetical protein [Candidatus Colwellbacteria bacterium]